MIFRGPGWARGRAGMCVRNALGIRKDGRRPPVNGRGRLLIDLEEKHLRPMKPGVGRLPGRGLQKADLERPGLGWVGLRGPG